MNKRKSSISSNKIHLYIVILSFCLFLFVYVYVYDKQEIKAKKMINERDSVEAQIKERKELLEEEEQYRSKMTDMRKNISKIMELFPSDITLPSEIMFIVQLEKETGITTHGVSLSKPELSKATTIPRVDTGEEEKDVVKENEMSDSDSDRTSNSEALDDSLEDAGGSNSGDTSGQVYSKDYMMMMKSSVAFQYEGDYEQLKKLIYFLNNYPDKVTIDQISMACDTSGKITGSISLSLYAVNGNGRTFTEPNVDNFKIGKEKVFDTVK